MDFEQDSNTNLQPCFWLRGHGGVTYRACFFFKKDTKFNKLLSSCDFAEVVTIKSFTVKHFFYYKSLQQYDYSYFFVIEVIQP